MNNCVWGQAPFATICRSGAPAAGEVEELPGLEAVLSVEEERGHVGQFLGCSEAPQRRLRLDFCTMPFGLGRVPQ